MNFSMNSTKIGTNAAINRMRRVVSSNLVDQSYKFAGNVASHLNTGGQRLKMGVLGAVGGAGGYAYGDGDSGSTIKGIGLGVLAGAAHSAVGLGKGSKALRGAWRGAYNEAKGAHAFKGTPASGLIGASDRFARNPMLDMVGSAMAEDFGYASMRPGMQQSINSRAWGTTVPTGNGQSMFQRARYKK